MVTSGLRGQSKGNQSSKNKKKRKNKRGKKKPKKKRMMEVKKMVEEWKIWDKEEEATKLEEETKNLVPERFHKWIHVFGKKASKRILTRKMWDHVIETKKRFVLRKRKVYLLSREERYKSLSKNN